MVLPAFACVWLNNRGAVPPYRSAAVAANGTLFVRRHL
jgi:hypothetical protein